MAIYWIGQSAFERFLEIREIRMESYSCDEPQDCTCSQDPNRPTDVGDLEDAPVEGEQREFAEDCSSRVKQIFDEET